MYQAGEFIVYGTNSVCRVESIGKPPFETEEDKLYYTLVPVTGTETIYIPTQGCMNLAASVNVILYDRLAKQLRSNSAS